MAFASMVGVDYKSIYTWMNETDPAKLNPERLRVLKNIQEHHKAEQINLLNQSPVGALAVANNDKETGLEWAKQQAPQIAAQTVYLIPSERAGRLGLEDHGGS